MKYFLLFIFLVVQIIALAQNPINPYLNYDNMVPPGYSITIGPQTFNYSSYEPNLVPGYNGEYMIDLHKLFWYTQDYPDPTTNFKGLRKSYTMEVVSFPFTMDCAFTPIVGCTGTSGRSMNLPTDTYDNTTNKWGANLWRIRDHIPFAALSGISGTYINPESLVSNGFHATCFEAPPTPPLNYYRSYLPHSIIKHTVYIHCGPDVTDPIATSFSWVYDNTRGRMRDYPFYPQNIDCTPCESTYDVTFRPFVLHKPQIHTYGENDNDLLFTNGVDFGTINYYKSMEIETNNCWNPPLSNDPFYIDSPPSPEYQSLFLPDYALVSSILYKARGRHLAGYTELNSLLMIEEGIKHDYNINSNFNLEILSPIEKVIYNPSEVNITASNLVFPSYYTFKTVRGTYPTENEIWADNTSENGGPFYDLSQVPVTTDLFSENPLDPQNEHVYASRYYLKPGSILTVESCVKIFDATFDIDPGATLIIDDYDQTFGKEDKSSNNGRYKLRGLGGAVLRNYSSVQFVQNGDIFQTIPLNYIATSHIIAGENVDPDTDQPQGIYEIKSGADVIFTAGNYIHLTNGFYVSGGDFHAVINENLPVPAICYSNNGSNGGNRVQQPAASPQIDDSNFISIAPNPNQGDFTINIKGMNSIKTVSLFDITGRSIYYKNNLHQKSHEVQLSSNIKGLMMAKIVNDKGETKMIKVVVD